MISVKNISKAAHDLNVRCGCHGCCKNAGKSVFYQVIGRGPHLGVPKVGSSPRSVGRSAPVFGLGSFSGAGVRADDVSRDPAGHRGVPECGATGLPSRILAARNPQHPGTSERGAGRDTGLDSGAQANASGARAAAVRADRA